MRAESFYMDEVTLREHEVFEDDKSLVSKTAIANFRLFSRVTQAFSILLMVQKTG